MFLRADGQVGLPPTISTYVSLRYSVTVRQHPGIFFRYLGGEKVTLVRPEGTTSRGHRGAKAELAQRAKVGYCPC